MFSNTANTVENAANDINMKKRLPQSLPRGRLLKMFGNVTKIRGGPLFTSTPYAKHAGKIISPDDINKSVKKGNIYGFAEKRTVLADVAS